MSASDETIVLGAEYDNELRKALVAVLRELGATSSEEAWGLVGSQELESVKAQLGATSILIESETYIGLSITGDAALVRQIATLVRQRLPRTS